jgi:hypothetical protein
MSWTRGRTLSACLALHLDLELVREGTRSTGYQQARARGRDSHAGGGMLDYSIRGPLAPSISLMFYSWIG